MPPMYGKCPFCGGDVTNLDVAEVDAFVTFERKFHAVTYLCPHCHKVLGAEGHPLMDDPSRPQGPPR
jgi:uncharacterized protein with PIN domain